MQAMQPARSPKSVQLYLLGRSPYFWILVGGLVTVVVLLAYDCLPDKRLELVNSDVDTYVYADVHNTAEFMDGKALEWRCHITHSHKRAFCGFQLYLGGNDRQGIDLQRYKAIEIKLEYQGKSPNMRYYFRNHEPGFSERDNINTEKFMQAHIATTFIPEGLTIDMNEFYVPDWWLTEYHVPRIISGPNFEHVTAFGIDLAFPPTEGTHKFRLHNAVLVGGWITKEQWYAGIIAAWLIACIAVGITWLIQLRKAVLNERQRTHLYRELSRYDQLTGVLNRHGLIEAIEKLFVESAAPLTLLVMDVDHFKPMNDTYGHDKGDQVLAHLGQVLGNNVRRSDHVARWGGEEFVIVLPYTDALAGHILAEKLRIKIAQLSIPAIRERRITVSIGMAERQPRESYNQMFKRADMALYVAKERGRNQTVMAEDEYGASSMTAQS